MITKEYIQEMSYFTTYTKGARLYVENAVKKISIEEGEFFDEVYAVVKGSGNNHYHVDMIVDINREELEDYQCECEAFWNYDGLCKHCVAAALEYMEYYQRQKNINDYVLKREESLEKLQMIQKGMKRHTTPRIKELLKQRGIQKSLPYIQSENWGQVRLEPIVDLKQDGIGLEFKIGITQMYVLKDVFSLVKRLEKKENYKYGKKLEFIHAEEMFTPQSRKYIDFLKKWTAENKERYAQATYYYGYGYGYTEPKCREIGLDGGCLDDFLEATAGEGFLCGISGDSKEYYYLQEEVPKRQVVISGKKDGIELELKGTFGYQSRKNYVYFQKGTVCCIPRKEYEPVEDFLQCLTEIQSHKIYIEQADVPAFCSGLLPELKKTFQCEMIDFDEQEYAPMQAECRIYLDKTDTGIITFRAVACYKDKEYSVYDDKTDMAQRDFVGEMKVRNIVNQYSNAYDYERKMMVLSGNEELLYELLTEGIGRLQEVAEVYVSDALKRINVIHAPAITVGVSLSGDLLQLQLTTDGMSRDEFIEMLSKYSRKKKYYRLKNGDFVQAKDSSIENLLELQEGLQLSERQLKQERVELPKYRALFMDAQLKNSKDLKTVRDVNFRNLIKNMKTVEDNDFEIPSKLEPILREYQKTGFLWMKTLKHNGFGGILADDMGLGKTLQVIAFLMSEYEEKAKENLHTMIVTPASLVYNWKSEFDTFAPGLPVQVVAGTAQERKNIIKAVSDSEILITSYDLLKRDLMYYQDLDFQYQVIDEAQFIKNHGTQASKAVKEIRAAFRMALTGTPIENRLSELWSIFDYLMPGFLFSAQRFREEFENKIVKEQDEQVLSRIQRMTAPFILRRLKKDVLKDLPEKTEESRYVPLQGEQQKLYDAHVKRLQIMLEDKTEEDFRGSKIQILSELTKIRQICCDPGLVFENYQGEAVKLDLCIQMIQNAVANRHKILVFSQFTSMLERIQQRLYKEKISFYSLTGAVNKEKRKQLVDAFQRDDTAVFCISLKAGGTGLNLTAADIVIHYDPWWNVAAQNQATDRAHRIGQKNMVNVYKLITKGTIEENILKLQERKKELADQILTGDAVSTASFSKEELLSLLQG